MLTESARAWLESRKIDPDVAAAHGVESTTRQGGGEWLAFPYLRDGEEITRKYRAFPEKKFSQEAGAPEKLCWNEDALRTGAGVPILTEGEMDALAAIQSDFERVASVPDGAPANDNGDDDSAKWSYIPRLIDLLRDDREIIIASDGDTSGESLLSVLARRLGKARVKYLVYPPSCKDLNDVLVRFGPGAVRKLIDAARFVHVGGLVRVGEMPPVEKQNVFKAGLCDDFDKHVSIMRKQVSVWTGVPGHGKSTMVRAVCLEMSRRHGWKHCVASFEDEIQEDYVRDVACYIARRKPEGLEPEHWEKARTFLDERFVFVVEEFGEGMTVDWLLEKMEVAVLRHGVDMIVIDPWSKLDHCRDFGVSEHDYTGKTLNRLKRFAKQFDVHVAVVAHPKKVEENRDGTYKIPGGYSVSGSSHWYNMPDLGVTAYKQTDSDTGSDSALAVVWKVKRHSIMGPTGAARMHLNFETGRYSAFHDQDTQS